MSLVFVGAEAGRGVTPGGVRATPKTCLSDAGGPFASLPAANPLRSRCLHLSEPSLQIPPFAFVRGQFERPTIVLGRLLSESKPA